MADLYAPYNNPNVTGAVAGFKNNAWVSLKEWMLTEAVPAPAGVAMGDNFKIAVAHTWQVGKGALPIYLFPKTTEQQGELAGDQGAKIPVYKPKIVIAGDNPAATELLHNILNKELIIWLEKADGQMVQFGSGDFPVHVDSGQPLVNTLGTGKAGTEIVLEAFCKFFYTAELTNYPVV